MQMLRSLPYLFREIRYLRMLGRWSPTRKLSCLQGFALGANQVNSQLVPNRKALVEVRIRTEMSALRLGSRNLSAGMSRRV